MDTETVSQECQQGICDAAGALVGAFLATEYESGCESQGLYVDLDMAGDMYRVSVERVGESYESKGQESGS